MNCSHPPFFFCGQTAPILPFLRKNVLFFNQRLPRRRGRATKVTKVRAEPSVMQTNPAQRFQQSNQSTLNSLPAGLPFTTRLTRFPVTTSYNRPPVTRRLTRFAATRLTLLHGQLESRADAFCHDGFLFQHRLLLSL